MRTNTPIIARRTLRGASITAGLIVAMLAIAPSPQAAPQEENAPSPPAARDRTDARWQPWLGCWEQLRDTLHEPAAGGQEPLRPARQGSATPGETRVCIEPDNTDGVRLRTEMSGQVARHDTIVADGSRRSIDEEHGCRGWQRTEWSRDGRRLFGRAELACPREPAQVLSQVSLLTGDAWFEFQGITTGGRQAVRVRRYRRIDGEKPQRTAPLWTSPRAFDLDAVKEASGKVDATVLQAALVETRSRFTLDGKAMLAMRDAGVPGDVTDLMVALSYPERFRVSRPRVSGGYIGSGDWMDDPFWGYAPYTSSYWAAGAWGWGDPGGYIVVPGGGGGEVPREGHGRVINNQGYTRIEAREPARARGRDASTGSTASTSSSGSSDNSGSASSGVSSSGYSSGGSSDGGGRTAVPR
jgi:uncharacterized membrane protein YgcG